MCIVERGRHRDKKQRDGEKEIERANNDKDKIKQGEREINFSVKNLMRLKLSVCV